jgi:hypothetical protein
VPSQTNPLPFDTLTGKHVVRVKLEGRTGAWVGARAQAPKLTDETDRAVVAAASSKPGFCFWYRVRWSKGTRWHVPFADVERIDAHAADEKTYRPVVLAA